MFERRRRSGVTPVHVFALPAIWSYVYACVRAGCDLELRLHIFERRLRFGDTPVHV